MNPAHFILQSHRGAGDLSTDNTIEAFELGWSLGTIPEADVRTTSDGVIVAFHDGNFSRVVNGAGPDLAKRKVPETSWEELSRFDVGSWKGPQFSSHRVPRTADIFDRMRGRPERQLYLDIKDVNLRQLAREVEAAGVGPQVLLASTDYRIIREWIAMIPDGRTLLWMGTRGVEDEEILQERFGELRAAGFQAISQLQIHVFQKLAPECIRRETPDPFFPSDEFLIQTGRELERHGILFQALPWGGATEAVYWKLLDLGVRSFATDHPDVTLEALRNYKAMNTPRQST